jgi:NADH:ubiquinone oxidoreductase subunit 4 (subunit M)
MLGVNLVLWRIVRGEWLRVIGQTPLFFYIAHLYLYAAVGALFFRDGAGLAALYLVWAAGLVPLYFACRRYGAFKQSKPATSVWRFF